MSERKPPRPKAPRDESVTPTNQGELVLYPTEDGGASFYLRAENGTVWLSQKELASLFQTTIPNINIHIKNVLTEGELLPEATIKDDLIVRAEGKRQVRRPVKLYNLDMILAVGYRVKSPRGTQFRQWATTHLKEYLIKGFVIDDERLKDPAGWDYFDELLERIRDIRASEKRFYQKVRDLFALSTDYTADPAAAGQLFAIAQNKMLFAVTQMTAAEIVVSRADSGQPNMALTSWQAGRVRKTDVIVAKNYLSSDEVDELNRVVVMFLDYADDRARSRQDIRMADWRKYVDNFISFNERPLLRGAGSVSHERMQKVAHERYAIFDAKRRQVEATEEDIADVRSLADIERLITKGKPAA
jgi:hypothetical protein